MSMAELWEAAMVSVNADLEMVIELELGLL
jgi:hypothetical protein